MANTTGDVAGFRVHLTRNEYSYGEFEYEFEGDVSMFMQYWNTPEGAQELVGICPRASVAWEDYSDKDTPYGTLEFHGETDHMTILDGPEDKLSELRNWKRPERKRNGRLK